ncbi:hypothetical protein [Streptomyces anulatus]|nr:hypothetical protein [Streptomyces anulatus]WIY79736.1 hypothetical protein QPM16_31690 [Streptomyces anulatus]
MRKTLPVDEGPVRVPWAARPAPPTGDGRAGARQGRGAGTARWVA